MMGSGVFESPLVSHARMRGLFRGLVETRALSRAAGRGRGWPKGLEAVWVGTALDLKDGDLVSDEATGWLVRHVRRLGARAGAAAVLQPELKTTLRQMTAEAAKKPGMTTGDRLLCAVGQAMALQAQGEGVVVAYAEANALKPRGWTRVLQAASAEALPLVLVTLPGELDMTAAAGRVRGGAAVPVIPVDAGDPLALYRVAQETMLRARADGGVAVIECLDMKTDPVAQMRRQLVKKGICTKAWVEAVETGVQRALERARR